MPPFKTASLCQSNSLLGINREITLNVNFTVQMDILMLKGTVSVLFNGRKESKSLQHIHSACKFVWIHHDM